MFLLRVILYPFALLYDLITRIRNRLYDLGIKPSTGFDVPIISVGNLSVGGTGKTPMVEHLIRTYHQRSHVATLSRGYGRKTRGVRIANSLDNASTIGDEPFQLYHKFNDTVTVAVSEDRALGIVNLLDVYPDIKLILMDDAFQHRRVKPALTILLTSFSRPFYSDLLLPAGRLRESKTGAQRADAIVVTKCPLGLSDEAMMGIEKSVRKFADKPVFFSSIHYGNPIPFGGHFLALQDKVILVTGIANAGSLKEYVSRQFELVAHVEFPDHHHYTMADVQKIRNLVNPSTSIITTEKDMVKLDDKAFKSAIGQLPFFYLPIEMEFIKNGEDFDALVQGVLD
ncbi:MAG TPA: tetraacyldisaccharide 4'-kinase [Cyclobacteriaceae bacterium]|nr:tetraacyldisaccharide 4'-kinase [Cyclobacteriaceae bacterium]